MDITATAEDLLRTAGDWVAAGEAVAIATVVETWGSAPRPPGSLLVCTEHGDFAGSVSGGCVEVAVIEAAREILAGAPPRTLSFGVSDEQAWSVGLACGGRIRVHVEPVADGRDGLSPQVLAALRAARGRGEAVVLATPLDGGAHRLLDASALAVLPPAEAALAEAARGALAADRAVTCDVAGREVLLVPHNPPLRLVIVGAVHIAEHLARLAQWVGYAVTVVDPRSAFLRPAQFPGVALVGDWPQHALPALRPDARTAVVLLTHDPKVDDPALLAVLPGPAFYVGALGSTRTHARRLERLAAQGVPAPQLARIHGPAGLPIGARTPAEIAVSVLAQMTQALRQATP